MNTPLQKLGRRIRTLREAAGLDVEALQAAAGVGDLAAIEAGERDPDYAALARLARALGCSVADLLGAMEEPPHSAHPREGGDPS